MLRCIIGTLGILLIVGVGVFVVMAAMGPGTSVVSGRQLSAEYLKQLRSLGLVDEDENLAFFYSNALMDIREGLYFVSDKKLGAYSKDWDPPAISIPHDSIVDLSFEQDDSFLEDSVIWVRAQDGSEISVPVSSDQGGDKKFYDYLVRMSKSSETIEQGTQERATKSAS